MLITPGTILKSAASLTDPNFQGSIICITEYNQKGAMGFVINKLFDRRLNALVEFRQSKPFPIYDGGPVDREHLFFIHQRPDLIKGGVILFDNIYFGGSFQQAVQCINDGRIATNDIKIFLGYCGWHHTEIEAEIAEGSWIVAARNSQPVF